MRLIDASTLIDNIVDKWARSEASCGRYIDTTVKAVRDGEIRTVTKQPTIDAVPVRHGEWLPGIELSREYVGNVCVSIDFQDWKWSICGTVVEQPNTPVLQLLPQLRRTDGRRTEGRMNKPTPSEPRKITITEICAYAVDENGEKHKIDITGFPTIHGTLDCETGTLILEPKEDA